MVIYLTSLVVLVSVLVSSRSHFKVPPGGLEQKTCIFSQFWRPEVWNWGLIPSWGFKRRICSLHASLIDSGGCRQSLGFLGWWLQNSNLCLCHDVAFFPVCLCVSLVSSSRKDTSHIGWRISVGGRREALRSWQRSWGRRLDIRKGRIEPQESPWKSSSIYPHNQSLPTLLLCALTYSSDFTGGCPPPPLSEKELT